MINTLTLQGFLDGAVSCFFRDSAFDKFENINYKFNIGDVIVINVKPSTGPDKMRYNGKSAIIRSFYKFRYEESYLITIQENDLSYPNKIYRYCWSPGEFLRNDYYDL